MTNFQRHTLIADRLVGDPARGLVGGEPRAPAWVAAATTAPPQRPADDPIQRRLRLFDGTGAYICPEGRPADIPPVDGVRVIVLYPPRGNYSWACGRTYEHMVPVLTLDHIMTPGAGLSPNSTRRTRIPDLRLNPAMLTGTVLSVGQPRRHHGHPVMPLGHFGSGVTWRLAAVTQD